MQAHEGTYLRYEGQDSVCQLDAGQCSMLTQYSDSRHSEFVTLRVEHEAANSLGANIVRLFPTTETESGSYRNRFAVVPTETSIVSPYRRRPTASGDQAAMAITDDDTPLTADRDHRMRMHFPRLHAPEVNALSDPSNGGRSQVTVWVRAASANAGPNWGDSHLPHVDA